MRSLAALLTATFALSACGPTIADVSDSGTDSDDGVADSDTGTADPRRDPSTWPDTLGGEDRPARLVTPSNYDGTSDLPVVMVLHGYTASGALQDAYFDLSDRVDTQDFVLIVPDGTRDRNTNRFWNATDVCCDFAGTGVDDVGYLLGLLDEVQASVPIDPDRITLLGHSNGGFMSYRMACEASDRLAGIASLAGANFDRPADCGASEPISVLQMHGTADLTIRYGGGVLFAGGARYPSAEESVSYWAELAGCGDPGQGPPIDFDRVVPGAETLRSTWTGCGDHDVQLWAMQGSGHLPGINDRYDEALLTWLLDQRR